MPTIIDKDKTINKLTFLDKLEVGDYFLNDNQELFVLIGHSIHADKLTCLNLQTCAQVSLSANMAVEPVRVEISFWREK